MKTATAGVPQNPALNPEMARPVPVRNLGRILGQVCLLLAFLVGGAWWFNGLSGWREDHRESLSEATEAEPQARTAIMVTAEPVTLRSVPRIVEGVGTLHGYEEVVISAKVDGNIARVHYEVGDRMVPGDCLVEIDPKDFELAVQQAESNLSVELAKLDLQTLPDADFEISRVPTVMLAQAQVENSLSTLERVRNLAERRIATASELDDAQCNHRVAQADRANQVALANAALATIRLRRAALKISEQELADAKMLVPDQHRKIPGLEAGVSYVMTSRSVAEGNFVRRGDEICRLTIDRTLKLRVPVPERYSEQIAKGQTAEVQTAAFADPFSGEVTLINPMVDPETRTFEVEIQIANERGRLKPGSFAKARVHISEAAGTCTVPLSALVTFAGVTKVFLAEDGLARSVAVVPGQQTRDWVEVTGANLTPEDLVITSGQSHLADESRISLRTGAVERIAQSPREAAVTSPRGERP